MKCLEVLDVKGETPLWYNRCCYCCM